jgi:capsular polysaccharide biosynthesis protein
MENNNEMEINLIDLFYYLKKRVWLVVAAFVLFSAVGAVFTACFMRDEYTAKTRMYVLNRSSETGISSSDYSTSNYMIKDYEVLIKGENVTRKVIDELGLNMSVSTLASKISVSAIDNTRVLQIVVVDNDPQRAADIANCVREVSGAQIKEIMDVDAVNLVYEAEPPHGKSGPNMTKNVAIAAILGVVAAVSVLTVIYMLDDTIKTEEDVERYLGLGTLGVIPVSTELENIGGSRNSGKGKNAGKGSGRNTASKPAAKKVAMDKLLDDSKK